MNEAYRWLVVYDPSGDFTGRWFRSSDLDGDWIEGLIFWNKVSGTLVFGKRIGGEVKKTTLQPRYRSRTLQPEGQ